MRKRSGSLRLTSMLAGAASLSLTGCGQPPTATAGWDREQVNSGEQVEAQAFTSLAECKAGNEIPDAACDEASAAALKDDQTRAPRYDAKATCEEVHGVGECRQNQGAGQGSFFTPLLAGFVIGRMLNSGGGSYYRGTGLYREQDRGFGSGRGGGFYTGWGGRLNRSYDTGRMTMPRAGIEPPAALRSAPARVQTRSYVASRGGFGGGSGRGYGG
jgi:uncharacterized protein YgiB involved in biofilm formation